MRDNLSVQPVPSATVVVVRDSDLGPEALLLLRNARLKFAPGAWVFPGGRIDPEDHRKDSRVDIQLAARRAASREAWEEAQVTLDPGRLKLIDHYITPVGGPRRFSTWFYIADGNHCGTVVVDDQEIVDHRWLTPARALDEHLGGALPLIRPTRETLARLSQVTSVAQALDLPSRRSG